MFKDDYEIIENLVKMGFANKPLDRDAFYNLYEPYKKQMSDVEFAQLLGINYNNFKSMKNLSTRVVVLKNMEENKITEDRKGEIRQELNKEGLTNKLIDYNEFLKLYESYKKEMTEFQFIDILQISRRNYRNMKNNNGKTRVLKNTEKGEISKERKEEIERNLKSKGYISKSINYKEFLELYDDYKAEMTEIQFANLLGIKDGSYRNLKTQGKNAIILKEKNTKKKEEKDIDEDRQDEIKKKLREQGYTNKKINYKEFLELYDDYKSEMTEIQFASLLGVRYASFNALKNNTSKVVILKEKNMVTEEKKEDKKITEERKKEIINYLKTQCYANKLIDYKEFLELYQLYKSEISSEKEFANVLGIKENNYFRMKNGGTRAKINFIKNEIDRIKYQFSFENRYYTKDELENLCIKYDITLHELISNLCKDIDWLDVLDQKGKLYIGSCKIDKEFQEKNAKKLIEITRIASYVVCRRFPRLKNYREDVSSEILVMLIEKKGDVVLNSSNDEVALKHLEKLAYKYASINYLMHCKVAKKNMSLDEKVSYHSNSTRYIFFKSKENTEESVESKENTKYETEVIINEIKMCFENGMNNKEALENITIKYNIPQRRLLKMLEEELSKRRKIIKAGDGSVYLGEEI